ncbi:hypothetical protein L1887_09938 [Cichorium endivia]|nr:hypothetical protein L1887_09938 [Cichorium endivia]
MEPLFLNASFGYLLDLDATLCKQISCILWFNYLEFMEGFDSRRTISNRRIRKHKARDHIKKRVVGHYEGGKAMEVESVLVAAMGCGSIQWFEG